MIHMHSIADRSCGNGLFRQRDSCFKHRQRARPVLIEYKVDSFTKMDLKLSAQQIKREMYPALDMVMYITAHGTDHWRHQELRQEGGGHNPSSCTVDFHLSLILLQMFGLLHYRYSSDPQMQLK